MPGSYVSDANAPELADGSNITATGNGTWTRVPQPDNVVVDFSLGTCTGTSTSLVVTVQAADDASGTNAVTLAVLPTANQDSDNDTARLHLGNVRKPYMRLTYVVAGTSPVFPLTASVQPASYLKSKSDTAVWA